MIGGAPPPDAKPEPLSATVTIALTPTEKAQLAAQAKGSKTSQSALGRQAILKALGGS